MEVQVVTAESLEADCIKLERYLELVNFTRDRNLDFNERRELREVKEYFGGLRVTEAAVALVRLALTTAPRTRTVTRTWLRRLVCPTC